jgi:hypothetical protein
MHNKLSIKLCLKKIYQEILKSAPASSYQLDLGSSKNLKLSSVKASRAKIGGAKGANVASIIIIHRDGNKPGNLSREQLSKLSAIANKYQ